MLLKYNKTNLLSLPVNRQKAIPAEELEKIRKQKKKIPMTQKLVKIVPGVNFIEDSDWKGIEEHPSVVRMLNDGHLVVVKKKAKDHPDNEGKTVGVDLSTYSAGEAIELIKDTNNMDLLKRWATEDERVTVNRAIEKKIDDLLNPKDDE